MVVVDTVVHMSDELPVQTASFTYIGVSFDTPNGSRGFVAANDGSAYENMVPNCVIIVAGTEHENVWLEFSPDDAIAPAQGIIEAAEHAKGGAGVSNDYSSPDERFAHIPCHRVLQGSTRGTRTQTGTGVVPSSQKSGSSSPNRPSTALAVPMSA